ncbi:MAG TPA: AMP-binding protein [Candidatus Methylomirabilis sp.]|nr:AMP-binding protein [Candidatus Methylomirabilis sp.]
MNLFQRFEKVAAGQPDRLALQIKEAAGYRRLTYGEILRQAQALAAALIRAGVARGDRVALLGENRPEWAVAYFGLTAAGAVAVPLDVQLSDGEIRNVLRHAGCRIAIASGQQAARLIDLHGGEAPLRCVVDLDAEASGGQRLAFRTALQRPWGSPGGTLPAVGQDALASILYTSGTTGTPKGVMLSHGNFLANAESILRFGLAQADDNMLSLLPLHHAFAFMAQLVLLYTGARITFPPSLRGPDLLACMQESGVTLLVGVPQLFYMLHRGIFDQIEKRSLPVRFLLRRAMRLTGALHPRGSGFARAVFSPVHKRFGGRLRLLVSGGARLDPVIARDFLRLGFTLTEGYGLTETAPVVAFNPLDRMRPGSVGVPLPDVEVRIEKPDPSGVGEIAIRGSNVMQGYYENPAATAEVIRNGWFFSGDLGYLDADGYLTITGRAKEVIVLSSGKNIYPEEVEEQYLKSPYIKEICLIPQVADRSGAAVEGLLALVLPDLDYFRAQGMTNVFETIRWDMENVGRDLPAYKRPTSLLIVKEGFPRTRLGKIQRHLVPQRYLSERQEEAGRAAATPAAADAALLDDGTGRGVLEYLRGATGKPAVRLDDNLELDLGMDSLARVEMLVHLEGILNIRIPDQEAAECFTVREVIERLRKLQGQADPSAPAQRQRTWREILTDSPPADVQAMVEASGRPSASITATLSRALSAAVFRTLYRLRVEGREHVPGQGPLILVANHCSFFDAFILGSALPGQAFRRVFFMGFEWFFRHPILAWWGQAVRVIPVDMDTFLLRALQASALVLRSGKILIIFPEGERSVDGKVRPFYKGTGILARELGVPILPAYIAGSFEAWPRGRSLPRLHRLNVRFGPVATAEELLKGDGPRGADDAETVVLRLRERVAALGGQVGGWVGKAE